MEDSSLVLSHVLGEAGEAASKQENLMRVTPALRAAPVPVAGAELAGNMEHCAGYKDVGRCRLA